MKLDLGSLCKDAESLKKTLEITRDDSFLSGLSNNQKDAIRAGVIRNFEFTYELCWKFMRRWLDVNLGSAYVDGMARRLKQEAEAGLLFLI